MSKTIKQIADEIGVSKQAVMYQLRKLETTKDRQNLATKEGNLIVVSLSAERLIKRAFSKKNDKILPRKNQQKNDKESLVYDMLIKQLEEKDRQIERLQNENSSLTEALRTTTEALQNTTESLKAAQVLHAGTMKKQLEPPRSIGERIKSFFKKDKEEL